MSINLHLGDCLEAMRAMPDNAYELAIVDPPYGIGAGSINFKSGTRKKSNFHRENDWDNAIPSGEYWRHLFRVSKNQIIWGANYMVEHLPPSKGWLFGIKELETIAMVMVSLLILPLIRL